MGRAWLVVGGQGRATAPQLPAQGVSCESLALAALGAGCKTTGGGCESLALAALGSGCDTPARTAGTLTGAGLAVGAAAASGLGASPGKAANVAGMSGCAIAALSGAGDMESTLVDKRSKG